MNEVINNILTRRSIRRFTDRPVSKEELEQILLAGIHAPSGHNLQTWRFFVMRDPDNLQKLEDAIRTGMNRKEYGFYGARALILVTVPRDEVNGIADGAAAMENMMLAAHSLGLGSCWINQLKYCGDDKEVREVLNHYRIPEDHICAGIAAIGHPASEAVKPERKKGLITWLD